MLWIDSFFLSEKDKTRQSSLINVDNYFKRKKQANRTWTNSSSKKKLNHFSSFNFYSVEVNQTVPINSSVSD